MITQHWLNENEFEFLNEKDERVDRFGRRSKVTYLKDEIENETRKGNTHGKTLDLQLEKEKNSLI